MSCYKRTSEDGHSSETGISVGLKKVSVSWAKHRTCLSVYEITVHEGVFEEGSDGVNVILPHLSNVFEQEGERLQHSVLYVQFGDAVFVHERG